LDICVNDAINITPSELKTITLTELFINAKYSLLAFQVSSAAADALTNRCENFLIKSF
jgi:hypothetical protein